MGLPEAGADGEAVTATVEPLFAEPWEDRVKRLALAIKAMQENPKPASDWSKRERERWRALNYQLALVLRDVEP